MPDASASPVTAFEYRYRDASNYKVSGRILLSGQLSDADRALISGQLHDGEFFVAEQVGVPPLYQALYELSDGPTDDDHGWHESVGFIDEPSLVEGEIWGTAEEFVLAFKNVTNWDSLLFEASRA